MSYRSPRLDVSWVPPDTEVFVVSNDGVTPDIIGDVQVTHVDSAGNVGFGGAFNIALAMVDTERVAVVNPDTDLQEHHWPPLADAPLDQVVTIPLVDATGGPTIVAARYPTPARLLLTGFGASRVAPRGRLLRRAAGRWSGEDAAIGRPMPIALWWASAAVCSYPTAAVRDVCGYDPRFFLYFEDVDLCRRLAVAHPELSVVVADVTPGVHAGGRDEHRRHMYRRSAAAFAGTQTGRRWRIAARMLEPR